MRISCSKSFLGSSPMPRTNWSLWPTSSTTIRTLNNFTCPCQNTHTKNTPSCRQSSNSCSLNQGPRISGTIYGAPQSTPRLSTITHINLCTPLNLSPGFGAQNATTSFESSPLFMDRLNTRNIIKRKKHKLEGDNYNCVLCEGNYEETTFHPFFSCTFSQQCWEYIDIMWNYSASFFEMIQQAQRGHHTKFFMETFIIAAWQIWKERNNKVFSRSNPSLQAWKKLFKHEALLQAHRIPEADRPSFMTWVNSLPYLCVLVSSLFLLAVQLFCAVLLVVVQFWWLLYSFFSLFT